MSTETTETAQVGEHTPAPWTFNEDEYSYTAIEGRDGRPVVTAFAPYGSEADVRFGEDPDEAQANARRIVAAVNGCEGIPTEALEDGAVRELLEALEKVREHFQATSDTWGTKPLDRRIKAAIAKARGEA